MYISASGLVVKSNIAIVGPRIRFLAGALYVLCIRRHSADMSQKPTFGCVMSVPSATCFCTMSRTCRQHIADMSAPTFHVWRFGPLADMPTSDISQLSQTLFPHVSVFSLGEAIHFFCGQPHWLTLFELFVQERETFYVFCGWQHLFLILDLSDWEWETYNICFVQQNDSCQIVLCLQVKEIPVSCYVYQHWFVKFWSFSQEEDPRVVFCVLQHHCINFEFFSLVRVIVNSFVVQRHVWLESVFSYRKRETLNIASPQ